MNRIPRSFALLVLPLGALVACGGATTDDTGQTGAAGTAGSAGSSAGSAGAGGGTAGSAGTAGAAGTAGKGGTGGTAGAAGTGGAGKGGSAGAAGKGGSAGTGGSGGAAGKGGAAGTGGAAGKAGSAGSGGNCGCTDDKSCGDFVYQNCVSGMCKMPVPDKCWDDDECAPTDTCKGAFVCPCGADCTGPDKPGVCIPKSATDWKACGKPGDCVLADDSCCGVCGKPQAQDKDAVFWALTDVHFKDVCSTPNPSCPACAQMPNSDLSAFCTNQVCTVTEVSKDDVSACNQDSDCDLHLANACCDCGTGNAEQYTAINVSKIGAYEAQICGPGVGGCQLDCAPQHPANLAATCDPSTKHCKVTTKPAGACPTNPPSQGAPCTPPSTGECEYGDDLRVGCRIHATCQNGKWNIPLTGCPPMPGPGVAGCPGDASVSGMDCASEGLVCNMGGGTSCLCSSCLNGPCSINAHWGCGGGPGGLCGSTAPNVGQACGSEGLACSYGVFCSSTGAQRTCTGGVWIDEPVACPL